MREFILFFAVTLLPSLAFSGERQAYADEYYDKNFQSPSGNIVCMGDGKTKENSGLKNGVSCFIFEHSNTLKPSKEQQECVKYLDWTDGYTLLSRGKAKYEGVCHGDVFWNMDAPRLPYGQTVKGNGWQCTSTTQGMQCKNGTGHGFNVGKSAQKIW